MERIFCANFCKPRGKWPACQNTWHAGCYECLGPEKFPVKRIQDDKGNKWYKHEARLQRIHHGVRGAHASIQFQCKDCWMINLEGRLPAEGLDDVYVMMIHQASLGAMGGRTAATIEAHTSSILQAVLNCWQFRTTPAIPPQGPMPMSDSVGMGLAVEVLFHLITAVPRIRG